MPAPCSDDLRQKAIAALRRGTRKTEVSRMMNISRNTLDQWLKREAQTRSPNRGRWSDSELSAGV